MKTAWLVRGTPVMALAAMLAGCGSDGSDSGSGGGGDSGSVTAQDQGVGRDILGTWYPWDIPGYFGDEFGLQTFDDAMVRFKDDGTWSGSDGCNGQGGKYTITPEGKFSSSEPGAGTAMGCANVPNDRVLASSTAVELVGDVLTFRNQVTTTGRYLRTPQAAPSPTSSN